MKHRIFQIDPSGRVTTEEADRHYETIHSPFARRLVLEESPWVIRYAWNRVQASQDVRGGFGLRPSAWRFVFMDLVDDAQRDDVAVLPARGGQQLLQDHTRFLANMRPYDVDRRIRFDRRVSANASAKFLLTFDVTASHEASDVRSAHGRQLVPSMCEVLAQAEGARLYVTNSVSAERETEPIDEPGQQYSGRCLPEPTRASIDELYFDNHLAGIDFFTRPVVRSLLSNAALGRVRAHWVREWVAVDRT